MPVKAVFFDLDDTLYDRGELVRIVVAEQYDTFRQDLTSVPRERYLERIVELDDHGYADKRVLYERVVSEWKLRSALADQLTQNFWTSYDEKCWLPEDTRATLQTLLRNRFKVGVITNGSTDRQQRKLASLGITTWFDAILISEAEGIRKPDPEIFGRALNRCGVEPGEAIFVGDHPETDVGGALRAGLGAVWKVTPYWSCPYDVPFIRSLSELLPLCDCVDR